MSKLAAIYVRTSSEQQGERVSPGEQERDCRLLAEQHGLTVVEVYRDIERYRARQRMVEPSGKRTDRPGLNAMLDDAAAGRFDTILAWKEDRLYRGLRAMLFVLDIIQEQRVTVMLARETFDPKMAPVKAWVAGMELDSLNERMSMGVKARLRAGKANTGQDRYGYQRVGEKIIIVEEEAKWVRNIFNWYNNRTPLMEIRQRLIESGAPQKGSTRPRKIEWAISSIQGVLKAAYDYSHGIKVQTRDGEAFEIPIEPIITIETYERYLEVRESNRSYPARHVKNDYLVGGLIYCECPRKWGARGCSYKHGNIRRDCPTGVYYCGQRHEEVRHPNCPKTIGSKKADDYVWSKVVEVLDNPDVLITRARRYVEELRQKTETVVTEQDALQRELDNLLSERHWIITQARKGRITEEDMEYQLAQLTIQEQHLKRELTNFGTIHEMRLLDNWEEVAIEYLTDLHAGLETLNRVPDSDEEKKELFQLKREIVLALVERVLIKKDREIEVIFKLDVLSLLGLHHYNTLTHTRSAGANSPLAQPQSVGTCPHTQSSPRPRRCAACALPFRRASQSRPQTGRYRSTEL
ncbi:MAG: recombinase family protein [Chloroflexi bacterium]|nr:recombinase family protein [Chloroflexota bacterium]